MAEVQVKQEPEWTNEDDRPIVELARVDVKEEREVKQVEYQVEIELKTERLDSPEVDEDSDWEKMPGTPKVSPRQWAYLLAFMEAHQEIARGTSKNVTPVAKRSATELWEKLAKGMNNLGSGTRKSAHQWREYWKNKRYEVRKKYSSQQKEASEMGRQALPASMYMSAKDERILAILGNEVILGDSSYQSKADSDEPTVVANYPSRVSPVPLPPPIMAQPTPVMVQPPPGMAQPPTMAQVSTPLARASPSRSTPSPTPGSCETARSVCMSPTRRIPIKRPQQRAPQPLEWARLMDERRLKMSMRKVRALEHLANSYSAVASAVQTLTQTSKTTSTALQGILQEMISMRQSIQQAVSYRHMGQDKRSDERARTEKERDDQTPSQAQPEIFIKQERKDIEEKRG